MRRLVFVLPFLLCPRIAGAVIVQANVSALRLDPQTIRLQVENVDVFSQDDLYQLFGVPHVSPFGDPVYLGPYGGPMSVLEGDFGFPGNLSGDVQVLGPGQTLAFGHDYAFDVASPPFDGLVSLDFFAAQDFFYEYPLPSGDVFRDLVGQLNGSLHFQGYVPAETGGRTELLTTPEPRTVELLAAALVLLALTGRFRGRRGSARAHSPSR